MARADVAGRIAWLIVVVVNAATRCPSAPCCCNGRVPSSPGAQQRTDYGTRCAQWDAPDERPWCAVDKGVCGEDTFESAAGQYWSRAPCTNKNDAYSAVNIKGTPMTTFRPVHMHTPTFSTAGERARPAASKGAHTTRRSVGSLTSSTGTRHRHKNNAKGNSVSSWMLCGSADDRPESPRWEHTEAFEIPASTHYPKGKYMLALYGATVVDGLGDAERKQLGHKHKMTLDAKHYVRAVAFVQRTEDQWFAELPASMKHVSKFDAVLRSSRTAIDALQSGLRCSVPGQPSVPAYLGYSSEEALSVYFYCPVKDASAGRQEFTISTTSVASFKPYSSAVCRRTLSRKRLTWCMNALEPSPRRNCRFLSHVAQILRYNFEIGVDRAIVYDRWGMTEEVLAPFVKQGKVIIVQAPPFYRNTTRWGHLVPFGDGSETAKNKTLVPEWQTKNIKPDPRWPDEPAVPTVCEHMYPDQLINAAACATHYGPSSDYLMFTDIDEVASLHERANEWVHGENWTYGVKHKLGPFNLPDWLDRQNKTYDSFSFCVNNVAPHFVTPDIKPTDTDAEVKAGVKKILGDLQRRVSAIEKNDELPLMQQYEYMQPVCDIRGESRDKWIARGGMPPVVKEPAVHALGQGWANEQRWYQWPKRPGNMVVPMGVMHFRHISTNHAVRLSKSVLKGWSKHPNPRALAAKGWPLVSPMTKIRVSWQDERHVANLTLIPSRLDWVRPMLEPWMPDHFTYSEEKQKCVHGRATTSDKNVMTFLDPANH